MERRSVRLESHITTKGNYMGNNSKGQGNQSGATKKGSSPTHRIYMVDEKGDLIKEWSDKLGKEISIEVGAGWASYKEDGSISVMGISLNDGIQPGRYKLFPAKTSTAVAPAPSYQNKGQSGSQRGRGAPAPAPVSNAPKGGQGGRPSRFPSGGNGGNDPAF